MMPHDDEQTIAHVQIVAHPTCLAKHGAIRRRFERLQQARKDAVIICCGTHLLGLFCRPVVRSLYGQEDGTFDTGPGSFVGRHIGPFGLAGEEIKHAVRNGATDYGVSTSFPASHP